MRRTYKDLSNQRFASRNDAPTVSSDDAADTLSEQLQMAENSEVLDDVVDSNGKPPYPMPNTDRKAAQVALEGDPKNFGVTQEEFAPIMNIAENTGRPPAAVADAYIKSGLSIREFSDAALNPSAASSEAAKKVQEALGTTTAHLPDDGKEAETDNQAFLATALVAEELYSGPAPAGLPNAADNISPETNSGTITSTQQQSATALPETSATGHGANRAALKVQSSLATSPAPTSSNKIPQNDSIVPS